METDITKDCDIVVVKDLCLPLTRLDGSFRIIMRYNNKTIAVLKHTGWDFVYPYRAEYIYDLSFFKIKKGEG